MFFAVNLTAGVVLPPVDVLPFLRCQPATVRVPILMDGAIDVALTIFGACCFAAGHLTTAHSLSNATLLVVGASIHTVASCDSWIAVVAQVELSWISGRHIAVQDLLRRRLEVLFAICLHLCRSCVHIDTAGTVEADAAVVVVIDDGAVIRVMDDGGIDVHDGRVVEEVAAMPVSTAEAETSVAKAVIHAAVEAHVRSPITGMPSIDTPGIPPITGRP